MQYHFTCHFILNLEKLLGEISDLLINLVCELLILNHIKTYRLSFYLYHNQIIKM
jgi:hypothetical protein